ncbi:hypothetical protein HS088_TW03G01133 [Tripterygium wilfordii]|uniref:Uncharacterized protein n=1 Tax=Tripterygium wilfordii TaxID=458696 RepID=A0A7J7DWW6_TRIWF|nr:uncharacterized protein LOC119990519 [Tripterygium wilfordii]KAF5750793.1 hypothetical protein HS088_TW03G01133 [Tripterygium wilfordii]
MDAHGRKKLDFNLPLLSTRRPGGHADEEPYTIRAQVSAMQDTSERIPFCWEQAPGKPKVDMERSNNPDCETPRPKLPPCRWHPSRTEAYSVDDQNEGCEADVEDVAFSDAMDTFSLTEAIDIAQRAEDDHGLNGSNLESLNLSHSPSPNFMMERFLPDATALAASTALTTLPHLCSYPEKVVVSNSYSSSHKGCGLEILFPWRMKHKVCGIKSPVRRGSPNVVASAKPDKHPSSTKKHFRGVINYR